MVGQRLGVLCHFLMIHDESCYESWPHSRFRHFEEMDHSGFAKKAHRTLEIMIQRLDFFKNILKFMMNIQRLRFGLPFKLGLWIVVKNNNLTEWWTNIVTCLNQINWLQALLSQNAVIFTLWYARNDLMSRNRKTDHCLRLLWRGF